MVLFISSEQNKIQPFLILCDGCIPGKLTYVKTIHKIFCVPVHKIELAIVSDNKIMFLVTEMSRGTFEVI